jgi:RNA polymerase sigma factor (sigma-70 family)
LSTATPSRSSADARPGRVLRGIAYIAGLLAGAVVSATLILVALDGHPVGLLTVPAGALVPVIVWSVWELGQRLARAALQFEVQVPHSALKHRLASALSRHRRSVAGPAVSPKVSGVQIGDKTPSGTLVVNPPAPVDFEEIFRQEFPALLRFARRSGMSNDLAEDAIQSAFLRAYSHWDKLSQREAGALRAYLYRLVSNQLVDSRRADVTRSSAFLEDPGRLDEAFGQVEGQERLTELLTIVNQLPSQERSVFMLHANDYSHREIAELLNITQGRVSQLLFDARRRLRKAITADSATPRGVLRILEE